MSAMSFDLDCGEALGGRHLLATGLRLDGSSDDAMHADYSEHADGKPVHPMVSLTYRLAPALPAAYNSRDLYATVRLYPPADPAFWDDVLAPGAERDATRGTTVTEAAIGPFILPDGTEKIAIHLVDAAIAVGDVGRSDARDRDLGEIVVDLVKRTARWEPTAKTS